MLKTYMEITWRVNMKALVGVRFPIILINLFGRGQSHSSAPGGKLKQFYGFSDNSYNNSTLRCRYINQYSIFWVSYRRRVACLHTMGVPDFDPLCLLPGLAYCDIWPLCGWGTGLGNWGGGNV